MDKKGVQMSLSLVVGIILLLAFLSMAAYMILQMAKDDFQYGVSEQVCRSTNAFAKSANPPFLLSFITGDRPIKPLCKAQVIQMNDKLMSKYQEKGETKKDATMRFMAEKMHRCQKVYDLPSVEDEFERTDCYICYGLQADLKDPLKVSFTQQEFITYITEHKSPRDKTYLRELLEGGHKPMLASEDGSFQLSDTDYAIFYLDNVEADDLSLVFQGALVCFVPFVGQIGCGIALAGAGITNLVKNAYFKGSNFDSVNLMELKQAKKSCINVVSS